MSVIRAEALRTLGFPKSIRVGRKGLRPVSWPEAALQAGLRGGCGPQNPSRRGGIPGSGEASSRLTKLLCVPAPLRENSF